MMRSFFRKRPDLGISIAFHLIIFFGLLLFIFINSCTKDKTIYVFELIETSDQSPIIAQNKSKPESKSSITEKMEIAPLKRMDYEQFLEENAKNKPETSVPKTQSYIDPLPQFNVQQTQQAQDKTLQPLKSSDMKNYEQYVYQKISARLHKPSGYSGKNLLVKVQFSVLSNGLIHSIKIVETSGNVNFDQSIKNALNDILKFKPTPGKQDKTFVMNFKLAD